MVAVRCEPFCDSTTRTFRRLLENLMTMSLVMTSVYMVQNQTQLLVKNLHQCFLKLLCEDDAVAQTRCSLFIVNVSATPPAKIFEIDAGTFSLSDGPCLPYDLKTASGKRYQSYRKEACSYSSYWA